MTYALSIKPWVPNSAPDMRDGHFDQSPREFSSPDLECFRPLLHLALPEWKWDGSDWENMLKCLDSAATGYKYQAGGAAWVEISRT